MKSSKHYKAITLVMPEHRTRNLIKKLQEEKGITTANKSNVRGSSMVSGIQNEEVEMLTVIVEESRANEIFNYLYLEAEVYEPHHGVLYQSDVGLATDFILPNIPES